jgi:hypothetical protein
MMFYEKEKRKGEHGQAWMFCEENRRKGEPGRVWMFCRQAGVKGRLKKLKRITEEIMV